MWLIVGLGNPGDEYEHSRHNIGFMVLDVFGRGITWGKSSGTKALYAHTQIGKHKAELFKPHTFMNKSGVAVSYAVKKHKTKPESVIVVHDDVDLPFGSIKISQGRGSGGHRGVESVRKGLKTKDFVRVRVGVVPTTPTGKLRKPKGDQKVLDHLMGDFKKSEDKILKSVLKKASEAVEAIVVDGVVKAMNQFNADGTVGAPTQKSRT